MITPRPCARRRPVAIVLASLALAACAAEGTGGETSPVAEGRRQPPALRAERAWARLPAPGRDVTAAYAVIVNDGDAPARIVGGRSAAAKTVELHEMVMDGTMMRMRQVTEIVVPAKSRVELKPGGLHLMLFGLRKPLRSGGTVPLTFALAGGGELAVEATVRAPDL